MVIALKYSLSIRYRYQYFFNYIHALPIRPLGLTDGLLFTFPPILSVILVFIVMLSLAYFLPLHSFRKTEDNKKDRYYFIE